MTQRYCRLYKFDRRRTVKAVFAARLPYAKYTAGEAKIQCLLCEEKMRNS